MVVEVKQYKTSNGRLFNTMEEAEAYELGSLLDHTVCKLLTYSCKSEKPSLYSAMLDLAREQPKLAQKVLDVLLGVPNA